MNETALSPLSPYRALDLTAEKGFLCGKILGDLGADVIKVEPPGGEPSRNIGPFYHDIPDPQRSLHWFALNTSKRGITLDLEDPAGKDLFRRLVLKADFVIETFPPGRMDEMGLGYTELARINPGIILVSISPFGHSGPYRDFKGADIVAMAMGGQMSIAGHPDRPPVRVTAPQAYLHAAAHAAVGALIALHYREAGGEGQQVDVSIQEAVLRILANEPAFWEYSRNVMRRTGPLRPRDELLMREVWPCRDGEITYRVMSQGFQRLTPLLVQWMDEEGMAHELKDVDWQQVDLAKVTAADQASREDIIGRFFLKYTKDEIFQQALRRHIPIMPASTPGDVRENRQLESRDFWVTVEHPELDEAITYPGAPFKFGKTPWKIHRRAPLIGEHNQEILDELASNPDREQSSNAQAETPGPESPVPGRALEGMRIVDFTRVITGPLITKYLAEFGAEVIKIESRSSLDAGRINPPFKDGIQGLNRSGSFIFPNSSKRSLSLNLGHPRAQEVARGLIARADMVVENFAPGVMRKWGLDYEQVIRLKPDIIMLSTSTLGQTGPYASHPGFGWNLSGLGGFNHFTGWPDREGVAPSTAYTDYVAPWLGVSAVLSAVDHRRRTGQGQHIDMSQFEAALTFLSPEVL
ncbi:MAG: CoA transferase, partial [Dehalococcoidia bacterium]